MKLLFLLLFIMTLILPSQMFAANTTTNIPILCYHNLNPTKPGSMNMTPKKFEYQIQWLVDNGFTVIPLQQAVEYLQGKRESLPNKAVVVTVDDGWQSVYTYMLPIIKKYNIPVTLFIYPETISKGKNAMTWEELAKLQQTGLFNIQSHTYSHPNFKHARKSMSPENYEKYVTKELASSKSILENKTGTKISYLAWPFGIYDSYLEQAAAKAGYIMSFTIDARTANQSFRSEAQPRYMIVDDLSEKTFQAIANSAKSRPKTVSAEK